MHLKKFMSKNNLQYVEPFVPWDSRLARITRELTNFWTGCTVPDAHDPSWKIAHEDGTWQKTMRELGLWLGSCREFDHDSWLSFAIEMTIISLGFAQEMTATCLRISFTQRASRKLTLTDHMGFSGKWGVKKSMFSPGFEPVISGLPGRVHH